MTRTKIASGFTSLFFVCCCFVSGSFEAGNDVFVFPQSESYFRRRMCLNFYFYELTGGRKINENCSEGYGGEKLGLPFCFSGREFRLVNATLTHRWDALSNAK